jgi:hypothetical protein
MMLVLGFGEPPVTLKVIMEAACDPKIVSNAGHKCTWYLHWGKSTKESQEKPTQKFDEPSGTIFRISEYFQRSKQKLHTYFLLNKAGKT